MRIDDRLRSEMLKSLSSPDKYKSQQALRKTAQQFEAMFLSMMLSEMRKGVMKSSLIPKGPGHDMVMSLLDQEMAKAWASQGGIGIADMIFQQLEDLQG